MASQQYAVAAESAKKDATSGGDVYRSPYSDKGEQSYTWGKQPISLEDIVTGQRTLPLVVKLTEDSVVHEDEAPVDLQRPLLLFREVKATKLHARNLRPQQRGDKVVFTTVGPYVILPENFVGYFKVMDSVDRPLTSVADLARHMPDTFISLEEVAGFTALTQLEGRLYQKGPVARGLYRVRNILEESIPYLSKRKHEKTKLLRCLACLDQRGKQVLLPIEAKGTFYLAEMGARKGQKLHGSVAGRAYKWTDLDPVKIPGLRVKLIHGTPPSQECQFTGWLELSHVTQDHTVIGCTMTSSPRLFEMAVTTEPYFKTATNSESLECSSLQQKCLKFVKRECALYMQTIKVRKDYDIEQTEPENDVG